MSRLLSSLKGVDVMSLSEAKMYGSIGAILALVGGFCWVFCSLSRPDPFSDRDCTGYTCREQDL